MKRYAVIWFPYLVPDRLASRRPELRGQVYVSSLPERGRLIIQSASVAAVAKGIHPGMILASARAVNPDLMALDHDPDLPATLLTALAEWCMRFTPITATDCPDGLILDISGCAHLWGGEGPYLREIARRLGRLGYHTRVAVADTIGSAWALSRYGQNGDIAPTEKQKEAIAPLPVAALRLSEALRERLDKLGLFEIGNLLSIPYPSLKKRFGTELVQRLGQALGEMPELLSPVYPTPVFQERLECMEPIRTAKAIEIAIERLLKALCHHLLLEKKGLRKAVLTCYRIDNELSRIEIGTLRPARNAAHLFRLFENKIARIAPGMGIELFVMEAPLTEPLEIKQERIWQDSGEVQHEALNQLLDTLAGRLGQEAIRRYLPAQHHWPERSYVAATSLSEQPAIPWPEGLNRPVYVLPKPEPIKVSVPLPDYPPMLFVYKNQIHNIRKADGPERIEREWWIEKGLQRDYYCVEDEGGRRYWLFRSGHYDTHTPEWFIHGFFA